MVDVSGFAAGWSLLASSARTTQPVDRLATRRRPCFTVRIEGKANGRYWRSSGVTGMGVDDGDVSNE